MDQLADLAAPREGGAFAPRQGSEPADRPSLHWVLRTATQAVHERLHGHAGFAAVQNATIGLADYRRLLVRLYGFYLPFEAAAAIGPDRTRWLAEDLEALGVLEAPGVARPLESLPRCPHVPRLDSVHSRLGAFYVVEGSALGGRQLARGLDRLLGKDATQGRRFFTGRGPGAGGAWRGYLARLSAAPSEPSARAEIVKGAIETFAAFEHWLSEWSTSSYG